MNQGENPRNTLWHKAKHFFVRTDDNGGIPHLLKTEILFFLLGLTLVSQVVLLSGALKPILASIPNFQAMLGAVLPGVLNSQTNQYRQENQILALAENPVLARAAKMKAEDMAQKGYFSHLGPENEKPWVWMQRAGYNFSYAGENLAINFTESSDVTQAWINSPAHKKNLANPRFTETGIGTAEGMYEGRSTIFVVQFFAAPSGSSAVINAPLRAAQADLALQPPANPVSASLVASAQGVAASSSGPATTTALVAFGEPAGDSAPTSTASFVLGTEGGEQDEQIVSGSLVAAPDAGAADGRNPLMEKIFTSVFVNQKELAKNILLGMMVLMSGILIFSISHAAHGHSSASGSHERKGILAFLAKLGHSFGAHKKQAFEVTCMILIITSVLTLGTSAMRGSAGESRAIGTSSESL